MYRNAHPSSPPLPSPVSWYTHLGREPRAEESKLNCLPEPEPNYALRLRLLSIYQKLEEISNFIEKSWLLKLKVSRAGATIRNCNSVEPQPKEINSAPQHCNAHGQSDNFCIFFRRLQYSLCTGLVLSISLWCSVADPWHYGGDPYPDPQIHVSD
jgi:hypothetical protein